MYILNNLNHRLTISQEDWTPYYGGEEVIKKLIGKSPIQLPEDYIEFLKYISNDDTGISFLVDNDGLEIWIWSAQKAFEEYQRYERFYMPLNEDFIKKVWFIGNDLGDLIYFYGEGKSGFGLYRDEESSMCFEDAEKIADTLTDFLVHGIGINVATEL